MKNISELAYCYGCGVCSTVCPVNIIEMSETSDGFYSPRLTDPSLCTRCGLCLRICSFCNDSSRTEQPEVKSFAAWSNDPEEREHASSGGVAPALTRYFLGRTHGTVIACRYNAEKRRAEHYSFDSITDLYPSLGSKYIPSWTQDAFRQIRWKDRDKRILITGTPCQIASLRRLVQLHRAEKSVLLVDFFCHGVPSRLLFERYLESIDSITPRSMIRWRDKVNGWQDSWAISAYRPHNNTCCYRSAWSQGDLFFNLFLGNTCLNRCCYTDCRFKSFNSEADLRLGDFWGKKYRNDNRGVSVVIAMTPQGRQMIDELRDCCHVEDVEAKDALYEQMKKPLQYPRVSRSLTLALLRSGAPLRLADIVRRIFRKLH